MKCEYTFWSKPPRLRSSCQTKWVFLNVLRLMSVHLIFMAPFSSLSFAWRVLSHVKTYWKPSHQSPWKLSCKCIVGEFLLSKLFVFVRKSAFWGGSLVLVVASSVPLPRPCTRHFGQRSILCHIAILYTCRHPAASYNNINDSCQVGSLDLKTTDFLDCICHC